MEIVTIVTSVISLVQTVLPLLGATGVANTAAIGGIISTLTKFMPMITEAIGEVPTLYATVKSIISTLKADPSTLPDQMKALHAFEAPLDAAWEAAATDIDPDAPGAA